MSGIFKHLVTILILVVVAVAGYYFFIMQSPGSSSSASGNGDFLNQQFLNQIQRLEKVEISRDFFQDARFRSFTSFSTEPIQASSGRSNPFTQ